MPPDDSHTKALLPRVRRAVFRPRILLMLSCGLLAILLGPRLFDRLPDFREHDEYRLETRAIEITPPPRDVPPDLVEQVIRRAGLPRTLSLLDENLTERIAKAFQAHPWVSRVVSVRKSFPPRVLVRLKYRHAAAMVETTGGLYPVDVDSILLPPDDFSTADTRRYPLVRGVQTQPQGPAGTRWGDVAVHGAARIADALKPRWNDWHLQAILVPRRSSARETLDDLQFVLVCRGGSQILWGRAGGTNHPGELTTAQKIGRLERYRSDFGDFDQPHGPYEIDIRHWQEITRRPISAARQSALRRDPRPTQRVPPTLRDGRRGAEGFR